MKFFNKNNDIDYTRTFDEYIREYNFDNDSKKNKLRVSRKTIKRVIASLVLIPTTLAVSTAQKVNEKESNYNLESSSIVDDISNERNNVIEIDMSKVYLASDGSYWTSEEDYILVNGNQKTLR